MVQCPSLPPLPCRLQLVEEMRGRGVDIDDAEGEASGFRDWGAGGSLQEVKCLESSELDVTKEYPKPISLDCHLL